jgi:hypothetical protein
MGRRRAFTHGSRLKAVALFFFLCAPLVAALIFVSRAQPVSTLDPCPPGTTRVGASCLNCDGYDFSPRDATDCTSPSAVLTSTAGFVTLPYVYDPLPADGDGHDAGGNDTVTAAVTPSFSGSAQANAVVTAFCRSQINPKVPYLPLYDWGLADPLQPPISPPLFGSYQVSTDTYFPFDRVVSPYSAAQRDPVFKLSGRCYSLCPRQEGQLLATSDLRCVDASTLSALYTCDEEDPVLPDRRCLGAGSPSQTLLHMPPQVSPALAAHTSSSSFSNSAASAAATTVTPPAAVLFVHGGLFSGGSAIDYVGQLAWISGRTEDCPFSSGLALHSGACSYSLPAAPVTGTATGTPTLDAAIRDIALAARTLRFAAAGRATGDFVTVVGADTPVPAAVTSTSTSTSGPLPPLVVVAHGAGAYLVASLLARPDLLSQAGLCDPQGIAGTPCAPSSLQIRGLLLLSPILCPQPLIANFNDLFPWSDRFARLLGPQPYPLSVCTNYQMSFSTLQLVYKFLPIQLLCPEDSLPGLSAQSLAFVDELSHAGFKDVSLVSLPISPLESDFSLAGGHTAITHFGTATSDGETVSDAIRAFLARTAY